MGHWAAQRIRSLLRRLCPHLLRDARHFQRLVRNCESDPSDKLVRFDVKDFFASGSSPELLRDFRLLLRDEIEDALERTLLYDVVDLLLHSQIVTSIGVAGAYYSLRGSGMGLTISGDLMNLLYFFRVEKVSLRTHLGHGVRVDGLCVVFIGVSHVILQYTCVVLK